MENVEMTIQLLETFRDRNMWKEGFMTHEDKPKTRINICGYAIETIKAQQAEIERLNALLEEKQAEIKRLKRKSRWIVNTKKYGEDNYHCLLCGAIVEKDEAGRHYWQRCYHCGAYMELMDGTDRDYEKDDTH